MNEHDSERLAGLLEAEGMEATDDVDEADVVVLNTCCIRENADNRLYGHLGHLKTLKARRPGMQIAVGGCLAQKDHGLIQARAPQVDAVFGTPNVGRAAEPLRQAAASGSATRARTRRTCAPRPSTPWPPRRRCASTSTCRFRRAATGCWPPCTAATPRPGT